MILTCPVCTTRYIVAEGAIGSQGRRVRCASCGHQWTQEAEIGLDEELFGEAPAFLEQPDNDDDFQDTDIGFVESPQTAQEIEDDFESILRKEIESAPIPEGVRPVPEDHDAVFAQLGKQKKPAKASKFSMPSADRLTGFVVAGCFYLCIIGVLLMLQPQISRMWPASNLFFDMVGMQPVMPGEGLSLDELKAEISEGKITMKGTISNLRATNTKVPAILATIVDADEKPIDKVLIPPPVARLKPEGQTSFDVIFPKVPEGAENVTFAFSFIKADPVKEEEGAEQPAEVGHETHEAEEKLPREPEAPHTDGHAEGP